MTIRKAPPFNDYQLLANTAERNSIPAEHRFEGMKVYLLDSNTEWKLEAGLTNSDWVYFPGSAASLIGYPVADFNDGELLTLSSGVITTKPAASVSLPSDTIFGTGVTSKVAYFNNTYSIDDASRVIINDGDLVLSASASPTTPSSGTLKLISQTILGRTTPFYVDDAGNTVQLDDMASQVKVAWWTCMGNDASQFAIGMDYSSTGTATARNVATTNTFTASRRLGFVSAGTANASAGTRHSLRQFYRGDATGRGGFRYNAVWGISDASIVSTGRTFVGFISSGSVLGNIEPSSASTGSILAFGNDSTDTNLQFMYNDGSGNASKINLGSSFPCNTASTDLYKTSIFCPTNGSVVYYQITNLSSGAVASGSVNSDLPASTTLLATQMTRHNGGTAAAVGLDISWQYIRSRL